MTERSCAGPHAAVTMIGKANKKYPINQFYLFSYRPHTLGHERIPWSTTMKKTLSFAAVHFAVAFSLGYLLTGSILVGGTLALLEPALNTIAYHLHERAWSRWGGARPLQAL